MRARAIVWLAAAAAALPALVAAAGGGDPLPARPPALLPDLDPQAPAAISVAAAGAGPARRYPLVFGSATDNRGAGPLIVTAHRAPGGR